MALYHDMDELIFILKIDMIDIGTTVRQGDVTKSLSSNQIINQFQ